MTEIFEPELDNYRKKRKKRAPNDHVRMPRWMSFGLSIGTTAAAYWFLRRGDTVTAASIVVIALSGWTGFRMGLERIVLTVVAFGVAIYAGPRLGMLCEDRFAVEFGTTGLTNRFLAIGSMGVMVSLIVTFILALLSHWCLAKRKRLLVTNSFLGFGVGIVEGAAMVLLVLGGCISLQMWQRDDGIDGNRVAMTVDELASRTRQSALGPVVRDYNPFEHIEVLANIKTVRDSVQRMQDPENVRQIIENPKVDALRSDPEIKEAIEAMQNDPAIKELLEQKRPMDREMVMRLMNSPNVMRLVDHPRFREVAKEVIEDLR